MATESRIEEAEKLLRTAEDLLKLARRDLREKPAGERLPAALWRLVDAAVLVAQLVPEADVGLKNFTGRGGRLEIKGRGCQCHLEAGDSPCPVHGDDECQDCGAVFVAAKGHLCPKARPAAVEVVRFEKREGCAA